MSAHYYRYRPTLIEGIGNMFMFVVFCVVVTMTDGVPALNRALSTILNDYEGR